ncbi:MAG TPA: DegQ family serine endoprotease [Polyangiaceae bacterium]|jgi:serine protease Do|nr:DegQ family serine endoprotease [Polyangiaceae bacterium]
MKAFGPKLAFVAAASIGLGLWPAACTGHGGPPSASTVGAPAATPGNLVPRSFLPMPSFAYAKGVDSSSMSIADVAERAAPSVVNVASSRTVKTVRENAPFFLEDPFFQRFFGPQGGPQGQQPEQRQIEHGLGSGVVISSDGIVLTNNHVVDGADEIKVTTADKREFNVKVIGTDAKSDLAVLKLQGDVKDLHPIELADSSRLRLGDVVLAIGNPFGVGQTITMGIVSAKGRANVGIAAYEDFIQTDAAINPGNSGGALVNMEGQLVGINTAILSRTGGSNGIGFAIPSNMAQPIMKALLDHGKVVRGWLGVGIQDVDQDLAKAMNLPTTKGVLISEVMDTGPAAKAGLQSGDVVLKLNGLDVDSTGEFRNAIAAAGAAAIVKLDVLRNGKSFAIDAKLGELPEKVGAAGGTTLGTQPGGLEGLTLEDLNPGLRQRLQLPSSVKSGVVVTQVDPGSPAGESGLHPGDVVLEVNRVAVTNVDAFKAAYTKAKDRALLRIVREGRTLYVVVKR